MRENTPGGKKGGHLQRIICAALLAVSVGWWLRGPAVTQAQRGSDSDRQFLMQAASSGRAEVRLGQLATQRAASAEVKQFGQRMVDDYSKANTKLMALAQAKNMAVAKELDPKHQAMADKLSTLQGAAFDRADMADHGQAVTLFTTAAKESHDAEVNAVAAETLPTLQEHLHLARQLTQR
jgi:putative membrane protein